jgi:hypothetical protein
LQDATIFLELRVGEVDAVLAHALGKLERRFAQLGLLLLVDGRHGVFEEVLTCLLRLLHLLLVVAGSTPELEPSVHRIGEVDAVLAHALGELEGRLLLI